MRNFRPLAQSKLVARLIVAILLMFVFLLFYFIDRSNAIIEKSIKTRDSLQNELFIQQSDVERYEIVIDRIKDEDSALYEKIEKYLSETE